MKKIITLIFLLNYIYSFSQIELLKGKWITDDNEMIVISDTLKSENFLGNLDLRSDNFYVRLIKDTISFQSRFYSSTENYKKLHTVRYDLKIININDSILTVIPVSKNSQKFFKKEKSITFIKEDYISAENFNFEKLIFKTSTCFGTCPVLNLQITADRRVKLNAVYFKNEFESQTPQNYEGTLDSKSFYEFIHLLVSSNIDEININEKNLCCDGAVKTLITYFNGKRNYINVMFEPAILIKLISYLYNIDKKVNLYKTTEELNIKE
ncbi:MAG: hypothetical protein IR153_07575 [Flavobacterium sp.]|nr:hypothetical protein [Flavobacterium sp.]